LVDKYKSFDKSILQQDGGKRPLDMQPLLQQKPRVRGYRTLRGIKMEILIRDTRLNEFFKLVYSEEKLYYEALEVVKKAESSGKCEIIYANGDKKC